MKKLALPFLVVILSISFIGCNSIKKALNKALKDQERKEVLDSLGKKLGKGLVVGATSQLASDSTAADLGKFISNLTDSLNNNTRILMDSLFKNDERIKGLVSGIVDTLDAEMDELFFNLSERDLKRVMNQVNTGLQELQLAELAKQLRSSVIGEDALHQLMNIRDSLLGEYSRGLAKSFVGEMINEESTAALQVAIRESMAPTIDKIFDRLDDSTEQGLNFAQSNINQILFIVGAIIFGILFFTRYQKMKYTQLVKNLTHSIEHMNDKDSQKELKQTIKKHATNSSVEPLLRKILKDQGIIK